MRPYSLILRLAVLPALAAVTVLCIAGLSIVDLARTTQQSSREEADPEELHVLQRRPKKAASGSLSIPELSEAEALRRLEEAPGRAALLRLWPLSQHRERLFRLLLSQSSAEDIRLWLLERFEAEQPEKAVEAARCILKEKDMPQGPLLYSAYEIIARQGNTGDLDLLREREFELEQTRVFREDCRVALLERTNGKE